MDQKGDAVLVVEIDDASHRGREEKDAARDDVVLMAGIATLRVPGGRLPSSAQLKSMLADTCPRFFRR
jgi:very-short-patch-repair endonuclease